MIKSSVLTKLSVVLLVGFCWSCKKVKIPKGAEPVANFEIEKFRGKWFEIARFDFKFEKNMSHVTANYYLTNDGTVKVLNRGYNFKDNEWQEKEGNAKFVDDKTIGALKVSFFGPFYSGYNVVSLEGDYEYALVFGQNTDYIWFLSRTETMDEGVKERFLQLARDAGYDLNRLVWTVQD